MQNKCLKVIYKIRTCEYAPIYGSKFYPERFIDLIQLSLTSVFELV